MTLISIRIFSKYVFDNESKVGIENAKCTTGQSSVFFFGGSRLVYDFIHALSYNETLETLISSEINFGRSVSDQEKIRLPSQTHIPAFLWR